ncbi:SRSO17 transposase [Bradyrhizobium sp. GM2.4]
MDVPKEIKFRTKPQIELEQIRWACEAGLPGGVALMDAAHGRGSQLRVGMTELGVACVIGIVPTILM